MLIIELNCSTGYCHDGAYAFFDGPDKARARISLGQRLERAEAFSGRRMRVQDACHVFRDTLTQAHQEIPGLRIAWSTPLAEDLAAEKNLPLSDAELWHVGQDRSDEWALYRYGSPGFDAHPDDHPVWLVHSWLANLANIGNRQRSSFVQLLPTQVLEVSLTQANDADLGPCWEAYFEVFRRGMPQDPGIDRFFLAAAQDLDDLHAELVRQSDELQAHVERFVKLERN